jgi:hypothetical protein
MNVFKKITIRTAKNVIFILSNEEIKKGDMVLAISGYPHWLDFPQECTLIFPDDKIALRGCIRVDKSCFRKIKKIIRLRK